MSGQRFPGEDLYQILEINRDATPDEIKESHRRLVLRYHPDKAGPSKKNEAIFSSIREAYKVLSDPARRSDYDRSRHGKTAYDEPRRHRSEQKRRDDHREDEEPFERNASSSRNRPHDQSGSPPPRRADEPRWVFERYSRMERKLQQLINRISKIILSTQIATERYALLHYSVYESFVHGQLEDVSGVTSRFKDAAYHLIADIANRHNLHPEVRSGLMERYLTLNGSLITSMEAMMFDVVGIIEQLNDPHSTRPNPTPSIMSILGNWKGLDAQIC